MIFYPHMQNKTFNMSNNPAFCLKKKSVSLEHNHTNLFTYCPNCRCFQVLKADWVIARDLTCKIETISYLVIYRKSLPMPGTLPGMWQTISPSLLREWHERTRWCYCTERGLKRLSEEMMFESKPERCELKKLPMWISGKLVFWYGPVKSVSLPL